MNSQAPKEELVVSVPAGDKQVYFLVYATQEDFQSLESVIKDWKVKNNKTLDQIGIISDLKNIPIIRINHKK